MLPDTIDLQPTPPTDNEILSQLAELSPLDYDRVRKEKAKALDCRPATLDSMVKSLKKEANNGNPPFESVELWPDPVEPAQLLHDITQCVQRFIICEPETAQAVALWSVMSWMMDVVQVAPLAVITAPEKRCGKSQLLFLLGRLVTKPLTASNITPAALFRVIDAWQPTILIDEADAFMKDNEELRGLINCGHTRDSAYIVRVVGDDHTPTKFNAWGAKAISGIGHLADTLMDRAIVLELRRKLPHESVDRLRYAEPDLFETLSSKLARFADDYRHQVRIARPHLPEQLNDRAQDNWEPLLAIADVAGGDWPQLARKAALKLSGSESEGMSVGVELLADIQEVFETKKVARLFTADLIEALCSDDEKPWATYNRGQPIKPRQVSTRLSGYGIKSRDIRIGYINKKGFLLDDFSEAFNRYLTTRTPPAPPVLSATPRQASNDAASNVADENSQPLHATNNTQSSDSVADLTLHRGSKNSFATLEATTGAGCHVVADRTPKSTNSDEEVF